MVRLPISVDSTEEIMNRKVDGIFNFPGPRKRMGEENASRGKRKGPLEVWFRLFEVQLRARVPLPVPARSVFRQIGQMGPTGISSAEPPSLRI